MAGRGRPRKVLNTGATNHGVEVSAVNTDSTTFLKVENEDLKKANAELTEKVGSLEAKIRQLKKHLSEVGK